MSYRTLIAFLGGFILALAGAFAALPERPDRSVAFLAVTAEEQGLLGGRHYAENPIYPTAATVAAINLDVLNTAGPTNDVTIVGYGNSERDGYVERAADEYDPSWELSGARQDLELLFTVGYRIAASDRGPAWNEGTAFKATREAERPPAP